jgi:hypothetical protein
MIKLKIHLVFDAISGYKYTYRAVPGIVTDKFYRNSGKPELLIIK